MLGALALVGCLTNAAGGAPDSGYDYGQPCVDAPPWVVCGSDEPGDGMPDAGAAGDGDGDGDGDGMPDAGATVDVIDAGIELPSDAGAAPELCDCSLERARGIPTLERNGLQLPRCSDGAWKEGTGYHCEGTYCRPTVIETACTGGTRCQSTGCR